MRMIDQIIDFNKTFVAQLILTRLSWHRRATKNT